MGTALLYPRSAVASRAARVGAMPTPICGPGKPGRPSSESRDEGLSPRAARDRLATHPDLRLGGDRPVPEPARPHPPHRRPEDLGVLGRLTKPRARRLGTGPTGYQPPDSVRKHTHGESLLLVERPLQRAGREVGIGEVRLLVSGQKDQLQSYGSPQAAPSGRVGGALPDGRIYLSRLRSSRASHALRDAHRGAVLAVGGPVGRNSGR